MPITRLPQRWIFPAVEIQDEMRSQEEIRGSLVIFADVIYDWDSYNVIIQRVAISPKNQDPSPGVELRLLRLPETTRALFRPQRI